MTEVFESRTRRMTGTLARSGRFRRGASILPSVFTTGNLFLGFWAIVRTMNGQLEEAAPLIFFAILLDVFDGRIARMTGTTSEFGAQLDSLADAISFGVAPALLAYRWAFGSVPRAGWLAAFLFVMCGIMRLARFNVQKHSVDGRYFVGMPIPAAAAQIAAIVHCTPSTITSRVVASLVLALVASLAFLMVSTVRYESFKHLDLRVRRSYISVLGIGIVFLLVATDPQYVLLAMATLYALSGPAMQALAFVRPKPPPPPPTAAPREA